jgi:hypothetical protein
MTPTQKAVLPEPRVIIKQIPISISITVCRFAVAILLGSEFFTGSVRAIQLTLDQGRLFSDSYGDGGMGNGRGIGFHADETFSMSALAIDLNVPVAASTAIYRFQVYASVDGHSADRLLASTDFTLAALSGYQDKLLNFTFTQNSFFVIHFRRADGGYLGQVGGVGAKYSWEDVGTFLPYDYGVLTILEGFEGTTPFANNPLLPHMRMTIVPEPSTATLAWLGMGVLALVRAKRRLTVPDFGRPWPPNNEDGRVPIRPEPRSIKSEFISAVTWTSSANA